MNRTKIIATLGPAVAGKNKMKALIKAGCNIARINTAHGEPEDYLRYINTFREASEELQRVTGVLLDIKGPELRTGDIKGDTVTLTAGEKLTLTPEPVLGDANCLHINADIAPHVNKRDAILIDDGKIRLEVIEIKGKEVITRIIRGGVIKARRGVNIPGRVIECPYLTKRDRASLKFAVEHGIDFIAASFTRSSSDIYEIKSEIADLGGWIPVIAKIENKSGIRTIDNILAVADGIMVARGDLGVELPVEQVPSAQKHLLRRAARQAKPAIIATQILESMVNNATPTRAEVSDIANAILDGTDALMLSEESAMGKYPVEAVKMLARAAHAAEAMLLRRKRFPELVGGISHNMSNASVMLAKQVHARAIVCVTRSGKTARLISRHKPQPPVIVATYSPETLRRTTILWGTSGFVVPHGDTTDEVIENTMQEALKRGLIHRKDVLVVSASDPSGIPGTTNVVRVHIMGNIIGRGRAFGPARISGRAVFETGKQENTKRSILVSERMPSIDIMTKFLGVIIDSDCYDPYVLKLAQKKGLTIMAGVKGILNRVKEGDTLNIDPLRGVIWH